LLGALGLYLLWVRADRTLHEPRERRISQRLSAVSTILSFIVALAVLVAAFFGSAVLVGLWLLVVLDVVAR
jgi:uncharacterized membrane protein